MKTTIFLDDQLGKALKEEARRRGLSLSKFLAESGRQALAREEKEAPTGFKLITYGKGGQREGLDLAKSSRLMVADDIDAFGDGSRKGGKP